MTNRQPMSDVIVLLPGIMGSALHRHGKPVWALSGGAALRALLSRGQSIRDLALEEDDPVKPVLDDGVEVAGLMPDLHTLPRLWKIDGYDAISERIKQSFDVAEGENYFEFAYDWRRGNEAAARRLRTESEEWLDRWKQAGHPEAKLVLVAHSMGGLVSRFFLEVLGGRADTRALITFGTPFRGSIAALGNLVNGVEYGPLELTEMVRSFNSIYQLLPLWPCYDPGDGSLRRLTEVDALPNLDRQRLLEAKEFHDTIERCRAGGGGGYRIYPVRGNHQPTYQSARLAGERLELLEHRGGRDGSGDGTVPFGSSLPLEEDDPSYGMISATQHGSLQNGVAALDHLEGVLRGLKVDLSRYRSIRTPVALRVEDLYAAAEPVRLLARTADPRRELRAELEHAESGEVLPVAMEPTDDGWWSAEPGRLAEGAWRVKVSGQGASPARDAFLVL